MNLPNKITTFRMVMVGVILIFMILLDIILWIVYSKLFPYINIL